MKVYNYTQTMTLNKELKDYLQEIRNRRNFHPQEYIERKIEYINWYMNKFHLSACVVAISGGIDSAVVLGLLQKAKSKKDSPIKKIIPVLLPCIDSNGVTNQSTATEKGLELCGSLHLKSYTIHLDKIVNQIQNSTDTIFNIQADDWATGQLIPYTRTAILYYITSLLNQVGYKPILCGTTNFSEGGYLGYVGKASDGMVDLQIISDIYKSEVFQIAKELNIPMSIRKAIPTGDMYDNRSDEEVFGAPYDFVEIYTFYLQLTGEERKKVYKSFHADTRELFDMYASHLENLHCYNLHKYIAKSAAIHLDIYNTGVDGGWDNHKESIDILREEIK